MKGEKKAALKRAEIEKLFGKQAGTLVRLHRNVTKKSEISSKKLAAWSKLKDKEVKNLIGAVNKLNGKKTLLDLALKAL